MVCSKLRSEMATAVMDSKLGWTKLLCSKRRKDVHDGESIDTGIGRQEVERDYDRILFAAPTRRLADKTQVFPMETNDSVRTRLTHSHEVSNLARSIGVRLAFDHKDTVFGTESTDIERIVPSLLAAVGLAHDLGNPPFGHQGEKSIQYWFRSKKDRCLSGQPDFVNFDGNCQSFRLLTRLQILNDEFGLNLTYATLACLMKYPVFHDSEGHCFKKFGIFSAERDIAEDVWEHTGLMEGARHPLVYVAEACDDIAYSVIDAEDTVKKRYASFLDLIGFLQDTGGDDRIVALVVDGSMKKHREFKSEHLSPEELDDISMHMFRVKAISEMIKAATDEFVIRINDIMTCAASTKGLNLLEASPCSLLCKQLKEFDRLHGFNNPAVLQMELRGHEYICNTMDMLWRGIESNLGSSDPFSRYTYHRISENYRRCYESTGKDAVARCHLLCDEISGMTESYLVALHDELQEFWYRGRNS